MDKGNKRWSIAVLLGFGVLVNYFDRVNLSVAHDALAARFGISDVTFGYLLGSYSWTYAAMQLPCGSLLDRFGVRRVMLAAIVLWALASGLAAIAPSLVLLFAARYLLGIGEAPTFPANAKAIGLWFPERQRGVPTATFDAAAKLSIGLGTPLLGLILLRYGLRANFATTAMLSLVYAACFAWIYRDPEESDLAALRGLDAADSSRSEAREEVEARKVSTWELLLKAKVLGAAIGSGAYNYCFYLLLTWLPFYLQKGLKMSAHDAVLWSAVPWLVAALTGFGIGGVLVDALIRRGWDADKVRRTVLIGGMVLGVLVLTPAFVQKERIVLVALTLAASGLSSASPVVWTLPSLLAPPGGIGRVGSIMNLAGQIAAITAPVLTGYLSQQTHSFAAAFLLAGVILILGVLSYLFLLGTIEPVRMHEVNGPGRRS
jgi:MFS family permease